jgi:diacylglycerol O-acyltransferase / wax synthase
MTRLSPLDATFLHVEDDVSHMHLGSVGFFEGPPPRHADLLAAIEAKLHLAPRYRRRVRFLPLGAGRPVWVDDPHFDLGYHVRRTALPAPGGNRELRALVGRVMSHQLDRSRPLWELWVVEGLGGGRWALITKLHHAMADGVSASNLITAIMDTRRDEPVTAPQPWTPSPAPSGLALAAGALGERAQWPLREARALRGMMREPRRTALRVAATLQGLTAYARVLPPSDAGDLNGPIGPHRRWRWARAGLGEVKDVRAALGGTVNDVILAAVTAGFRDLLLARGATTDRSVRTLVPVSVRAADQDGHYDNRVSAIFAELPVAIGDPLQRLHAITAQMERLKATHEAVAGEALTSMAGFAPEVLLSLSGRIATHLPQHNVATVTTNVPGPQAPLYLAGRRMLETFPYVPLAGHVRIGVAIYSYDGTLGFGVTGDYETAPDIGIVCDGIERAVDELVTLAARRSPTSSRSRARTTPG